MRNRRVITANQIDDYLVYNSDDDVIKGLKEQNKAQLMPVSTEQKNSRTQLEQGFIGKR